MKHHATIIGAVVSIALLAGEAAALAEGSHSGAPAELSDRIASGRPAGCAEFGFLFFRFFRAELWTDAAVRPGDEFALSLVYRRNFSRENLISTSISEMARISGRPEQSFAEANAAFDEIMRDVSAGDRFTAWRGVAGQVEFFFNGEYVGELTRDANLFLDIWLGPESRDANRRDRILTADCHD